MSEERDRISRIAAERMLSPTWVGWSVGSDPLADLLAAHAEAAREDQQAGRRATRGAHRSPIRATRRQPIVKLAIARLATAKAVVAVIALGGGVAWAAGTGHMPGVGSSGDHRGARLPAETTAGASASPTGDSTFTGGSTFTGASTSAGPSGTPSASLRDLCVAIDTAHGAARARALDDPAFTVLITAAGGKDKVAAYCAPVLAAGPGSSSAHPGDRSSDQSASTPTSGPPSTPSPSGPPSTPSPSGPPSTHPTGPPSTHPNGPRTSHPSARQIAPTTG